MAESRRGSRRNARLKTGGYKSSRRKGGPGDVHERGAYFIGGFRWGPNPGWYEDTEGGFKHGGWTRSYWHDAIGSAFGAMMQETDAFLLGRKTYLIHGNAFEPLPAGDFFGDMMNAPAKYVVSKTLQKPVWRNTTIIRDNVVEAVQKLKAGPGKNILTDGSHELVHTLFKHDLVDELHLLLYPLMLGSGKRLLPEGAHLTFKLKQATPYPSGVVALHYERAR